MRKVRFGIIGCGNMGRGHARQIIEANARDFCLTAVADIDTKAGKALADQYDLEFFDDGAKLIRSGACDAVIIATPHYFHPPLTIEAARAGVHVLCEKPIAVSVGPARAMVAECRKRKIVLGVMFQQRNRPAMRKMKQMIDSGAIGEIVRFQMICSAWYRTQAYYESGAWRGTWDGEGGGILLNQAPHSLDLFQWLGGMPKRVTATVATRTHRIEVENTANAILDYGDGRTGYIYATTAEAPGMEQWVFAGDKGTLVSDGSSVRFAKLAVPLTKHLLTSKQGFGRPNVTWRELPLPKLAGGHIAITRAFVAHILRGKPLAATGKEGINELELSNAIYLSGFTHKTVELPVKAADMERLLNRLIRQRSTGRGGNLRRKADAQLRRLLGKFPA